MVTHFYVYIAFELSNFDKGLVVLLQISYIFLVML